LTVSRKYVKKCFHKQYVSPFSFLIYYGESKSWPLNLDSMQILWNLWNLWVRICKKTMGFGNEFTIFFPWIVLKPNQFLFQTKYNLNLSEDSFSTLEYPLELLDEFIERNLKKYQIQIFNWTVSLCRGLRHKRFLWNYKSFDSKHGDKLLNSINKGITIKLITMF
jgi:hypothetical protein